MLVDYIRVYQPAGANNIGCDPPEFPTAAYIDACVPSFSPPVDKTGRVDAMTNRYKEAYTNFNLTGWGSPQYNQTVPKNKLNGGC